MTFFVLEGGGTLGVTVVHLESGRAAGLRALPPKGTPVWDKTGSLEGSASDAGFVELPDLLEALPFSALGVAVSSLFPV